MAIFSTGESTASKIQRAEKEFEAGVFKQWIFELLDTSNNIYEWNDTNVNLQYGAEPTDTEVSTYVHVYLTGGVIAGGGLGNYDGVEKVTTSLVQRNQISRKGIIGIAPNATPDYTDGDLTTPDTAGADSKTGLKYSTQVLTFVDLDATPSVGNANMFLTNTSTVTITDFDDAENYKRIIVISKGAITYDVTSSGLIGGSTNIVTATGDVTEWIYVTDKWYLTSFMDVSASLTGGH